MSVAALLGLGTGLNAIVSYMHGKASLKLQERFFEESRADQAERFHADIDLRRAHFNFSVEEATRLRLQRLTERTEDFERQNTRDQQARSFSQIRRDFNGTPQNLWLDEPHNNAYPNMKSLRVFIQRPQGELSELYQGMERSIRQAVTEYEQLGLSYPVLFSTGALSRDAQSGSWFAKELHAWNQTVPTLILRLDPCGQDMYALEADLFGFPIGDRNLIQNIGFGSVQNDPNQILEALPLLTLATADMYFAYTYGKAPLLPTLLPRYLKNLEGDISPALESIVNAYRNMVSALAKETPEIGLMASLNLAESLTALPNKTFAIEQIAEIEDLTRELFPNQPELIKKISDLYVHAGANEDSQRLLLEYKPENTTSETNASGKPSNYSTLEKFL